MTPWERYSAQKQGREPIEADGPWSRYQSNQPVRPEAGRDLTASEAASNSMAVATQFAHGFNTKLADLYSAPSQAGHALFSNLLGNEERMQDPVERFLRSGPEPTTEGQRIARRAGEEVGVGLPMATLPFAAAAGPAAQTARTALGRGLQSVVEGVRHTPGRAAVGELTATVGAGTGAGIAQEIAPDSDTAEIIGQVAGGMAPTVLAHTPTALVGRGLRAVTSRLSPEAQTAAARRAVGDMVGPHMGPEAEGGLAEAERLRAAMPGFNPTTAESTGAPALIAHQRGIEGKAQGADLSNLARRRSESEAAIGRYAEENAPAADDAPEFVVDVAAGRIQTIRGAVDRPLDAVDARQREVAARLPRADRAAAGQRMREVLHDRRDQVRGQMSALADELGINDVDLSIPFHRQRQALLRDFTPGSVFEDRAALPKVLADIESLPPNTQVTFRDLKSLRERVNDDLMDAQAAASPNRKEIRMLAMLKERVDGWIDTMAETADPQLAERYRQFRDAYRRDYIERFEVGPAFKVRHRNGRGEYRIRDEEVASAFFEPGNITAARQFHHTFGDDPEARAALRAVALDSLGDAAVRDGRVDARRLETWMRRHASVLDEFPDLRVEVGQVDAITRELGKRRATLEGRRKRIEDALLTREITKMGRGWKDEGGVIGAALKDPRKMGQLIARLRSEPDAQNALRRHIWDQVAPGTADDIATALELPSVQKALGPDHVSHLRNIQAARQMLERTPPPTGQAYDPNPLQAMEDAIGMGVPQLGSRIFAVHSGRTSWRYVATDAFGRFWRGRSKAETDALLREALYDPQVAKDLSALVTKSRLGPQVQRRLNTRLFALGLVSEDQQDQQQPAPEGTAAQSLKAAAGQVNDFAAMGLEDLQAMDPSTMSDEELAAAAARWEALNR